MQKSEILVRELHLSLQLHTSGTRYDENGLLMLKRDVDNVFGGEAEASTVINIIWTQAIYDIHLFSLN